MTRPVAGSRWTIVALSSIVTTSDPALSNDGVCA
jgi:hypothetical protein